jgi:TRAP transporter TAXI family solute receptor
MNTRFTRDYFSLSPKERGSTIMKRELWIQGSAQVNRRTFLKATAIAGGAMIVGLPSVLHAADKKRISIATGGMGGVYFVIGGGIAGLLTKYAGVEATAEVTAASVDNCKLVGAGKSDLAFVMGDTAYDAYKGAGAFAEKPLPLRTMCVLYPNLTHVVTTEGAGIKKVAELKGKRVSTGAPGSGTEVMALRVLEAAGIDHAKDIKKDRLGASESAGALKDGKIDAYFWVGGVPTASVLDLSATPGMKIQILSHDDLVPAMISKFGPTYYTSTISKGVYTNVNSDVPVSAVANLLLAHKDMDNTQAYQIKKAIFDHLPELVAIHKEAANIKFKEGSGEKGIPYHPGAQKFFKENGIDVPA